MIIVDCAQGSPEWFRLRAGMPTASKFDQLLTPKTRKPSTQAFAYLCRLVFERLAGESYDGQSESAFMARGTEMEDEARRWYEFRNKCDVRRVGLILRDDRSAACSPDGLVGEDGLLEIKVPGGKQHVGYMIQSQRLIEEYVCQVQGQLWIAERKWCDLISYNPLLRPVSLRIERDDEFIADLAEAVRVLQEDLHEALIVEGVDPASTVKG